MNKTILGWLAAVLLLPATSVAHDFDSGRRDARYEPVVRGRPWYETNRRSYWHLYRVPRRHGPGFDSFYHWHPAERFDRFADGWDRRGIALKGKKSIDNVQSRGSFKRRSR